jgi:hypothetical protein
MTIEDTRTIDDPRWIEDAGFFALHPERQHYARLMPDGSTCVVRLHSHAARQSPVFVRTYGLILTGDPEPAGEEACAEAWQQLVRGR